VNPLGVGQDNHAVGGGRGAGADKARIPRDLHRANPASAVVFKPLIVTKRGNFNPVYPRDIQYRLPRLEIKFVVVYN
jgi:hypothetical protein